MSMLLWLLIIRYLITLVSAEIFTTGVGLFTSRAASENNSGCYLLQKQAGDAWWSGGFFNCISKSPNSFGLDWQIIPFRISVNSKIFYNYPEHGHDVEQYAFINKELNAPGKQCLTVTGSSWWIEQIVHNFSYDIRMFYSSPVEILNSSVCSTLSSMTYDKTAIRIVSSCSSKPLERTANQRTHQIQLTIHIFPLNMLLSESIHKSIQLITGRTNTLSDQCVFVTGVLKFDFGRAVAIDLQFKGDINATNSCALLSNASINVHITSGIFTCESDVISHTGLQWNIHAIRLRVRETLNGIPLYLMSNTEIALRVEALFNFEKVGCTSFEPGQTAILLKASDQRLVSFISAPRSADICNQVNLKMGANFYTFYKSCVKETKHFILPNENRLSSHRLEANEPFYEIDEMLYLEKHAQLVYDLNKAYLSCEYNGYIQREPLSNHQPDGRN